MGHSIRSGKQCAEFYWDVQLKIAGLCFTIAMAAVGCEGRICEKAVAGYVRSMVEVFRIGTVV